MPKIIAPTHGCILEAPDERDFRAELLLSTSGTNEQDKPVAPLPKSFKVSHTQPYTNQRYIDSCVGHAVAGIKSQQERTSLSPRNIWVGARELRGWTGAFEYMYGAYITDALKFVVQNGVTTYGLVEEDALNMSRAKYLRPEYTPEQLTQALQYKAESYWRGGYGTSAQTIETVKRAMFELDTEFVTSMTWHTEFNNPKGGVLPLPKTRVEGHAFRFRGWETKLNRERLIFANSWGLDWGDQGDFYIYTDQLHNYDLRGWYMFYDMPKDQARIINNYQKQLIKNPWSPKVYIVTNNNITWIETEKDFNWARTVLWGDWKDIVTVEDIEIVETNKVYVE